MPTQFLSAEVELNKLILVRPTPLVYYEALYIDRRDYDDIMDASHTAWHRLLRHNLEFLAGEGLVRPVPFEPLLTNADRVDIAVRTDAVMAGVGAGEMKLSLEHAWKHYAQYLDLKADVACRSASDSALITMFAEGRKAWMQHQNLRQSVADDRLSSIYRHCLWKTEASRRIAERQSAVLHMAREYEPFLLHLNEHTARRTLASKVDEMIQHIFDLALPMLDVEKKDARLAFLALRKTTLPRYRELCDRLEEIIVQFQNEDLSLEDAKAYLTARWNEGLSSLGSHIGFARGLLITAELLLKTYLKSHVPAAPELPKEIRAGVETVSARPLSLAATYSPYRWQALFCSLFNETEFQRARKEVARAAAGAVMDSRANSGMWLDDPDQTPWYVA